MSEEEVMVKVKSEDGYGLVIETPEGNEETYRLSPFEPMYLHIEKLQVFTGDRLYINQHLDGKLDRYEINSQPDLSPSLYVQGTAGIYEHATGIFSGHSQKSISVIGWPRNSVRSICVKFRVLEESERKQREMDAQKEDNTPRYTYARVGCYYNNECSEENRLYALCVVSPDTLDAISSAVSSNTLREMTVGLNLQGIYWGPGGALMEAGWFLKPHSNPDGTLVLDSPMTAHGYITQLTLAMAAIDLRPQLEPHPEPKVLDGTALEPMAVQPVHQTTANDTTPEPMTVQPVHRDALYLLSETVEKLRVTLMWVGIIIAFFLLLLAFK